MTRWYREGSWAGCLEVGLPGSHSTPSRKGGELDLCGPLLGSLTGWRRL